MKKVLVTEALDQEGINRLRNHFEVDTRQSTSEEELIDIIGRYDGLMIWTYTWVTKAVLERADRLKVIARAGIGLEKIDLECAEQKGIVVRNTPEGNTTSVAEMVFSMMLSVVRKVVLTDAYVRSRTGWDRDQFTGNELSEKVLGIIGLGNIGKKVAKRASAFEMNLIGYDPYVDESEMAEHGVSKAGTLDDLLAKADFVTIHVTLTDATRRFIGERELDLMKDTAVLINTSRGTVLDQKALVDALKEGKIRGAGLDVFETEPPEDTELLGLKNIVVSPHIAGTTHEALQKMTSQAADIIIEYLNTD